MPFIFPYSLGIVAMISLAMSSIMFPKVLGKRQPWCWKGTFVILFVKEEFPAHDLLCGVEPPRSSGVAQLSTPCASAGSNH